MSNKGNLVAEASSKLHSASPPVIDLFGDEIPKITGQQVSGNGDSDSASDDEWRTRSIKVIHPPGTRIPRLIRGISKSGSRSAPSVNTGATMPPTEQEKPVRSGEEGIGIADERSRNTLVETGEGATAITFRVISADIETTCQIMEFGSVLK